MCCWDDWYDDPSITAVSLTAHTLFSSPTTTPSFRDHEGRIATQPGVSFSFLFNAILQSMQIPPGVSYQESSDWLWNTGLKTWLSFLSALHADVPMRRHLTSVHRNYLHWNNMCSSQECTQGCQKITRCLILEDTKRKTEIFCEQQQFLSTRRCGSLLAHSSSADAPVIMSTFSWFALLQSSSCACFWKLCVQY